MRFLIALLLAGCTTTVSVQKTPEGFVAKVPRDAYLKTELFEYDGRERESTSFLEQLLTLFIVKGD